MLRISIVLLCVAISVLTYGHGEVHERIDIVTDEISGSPESPMLYIKRASLYLEDGNFDKTILDIEQAKALAGEEYPPAMMTYAKLCFKMNTYEVALKHINNYLSYEDNHVLGLLTKAQILDALEKKEEAAKCYQLAIEKTTTHLPENFLDLINIFIENNQLEDAYQCYLAAQLKFGKLLVFDLKAIEISLARDDFATVHKILDEIILSQERKEKWYFKKAEIFELQGDYKQANEQLELSLSSLKALPQRLKLTQAMQKLSAQISEKKETYKTAPNEITVTKTTNQNK